MRSLLVICPHRENTAPSQRLKYEQYFDHWRGNGYEVVVRHGAKIRDPEIA